MESQRRTPHDRPTKSELSTQQWAVIDTTGFAALGMSTPLLEYIERQRYPAIYQRTYWWMYGGTVLAMLALFGVVLLGHLTISAELERRRTAAMGEIWYYDQFVGPSIVLGIFVAIFFLACVWTIFSRMLAGDAREYANLKSLETGITGDGLEGRLARQWARWLLRGLDDLLPEEQIRRYERRTFHSYLWPLLLLSALTAAFAFLDYSNYDVVGPKGYRSSAYWSTQPLHKDFKELERVKVGCWVFESGGLSLRYQLVFRGGADVNLLKPLPDERVLQNTLKVEQIAKLRKVPKQLHVFTHGIHNGEEFWDDECIPELEEKYSKEELGMLAQLLNVPALNPPDR